MNVRLEIKVPDLGMQTEEIKFGQWLKAIGDRVESGEDLFEVEADKATVICEAEASGTLAETLVEEGLLFTGQLLGYLDA
jgi:pyruvate/2-oxoglutarate dehydrogenase complex dihydrolipoamide acyltransferase (E2) component